MDHIIELILFNERVVIDNNKLDIQSLVIYNEEILENVKNNVSMLIRSNPQKTIDKKISKNERIKVIIKEKLDKFKKQVIIPLIHINVNELYNKLITILRIEIEETSEDDIIYHLFVEEVSNYVIMCIKDKKFTININLKSIMENRFNFYGNGNFEKIINAIITSGKKIDIDVLLNRHKYGSFIFFANPEYNNIITEDNIPEKINPKTCKYIKENLTLKYINVGDKLGVFFFSGPVIEYEYDGNKECFIITNNNRLKVIVKILFKCKALMLISEYLKEQPTFDVNEEDPLYFVGKDANENKAIYELQKEEFKRLLRLTIRKKANSNIRLSIAFRKALETNTSRVIEYPLNLRSSLKYEKKLQEVIDGRIISKSKSKSN